AGRGDAVLREYCDGEDSSFRAEVQSLIDAYRQTRSFVERPIVERLDASQLAFVARVLDEDCDELPSGERLGPYEIVELVGSGGMGRVYRVRDSTLDRDIAIKVLRRELQHDPERLRSFM